jgi:serine protease Do
MFMKKQELLIAAGVAAAVAFMLGLILAGVVAPHAPGAASELPLFPDPGNLARADAPAGLVNFAEIVETVNPAVVNIIATGTDDVEILTEGSSRNPFDFFGDPHEGLQVPRRGSGSGFFIDREGYLLTNHHVIDGAQRVEVTLMNSGTVRASVVGSDPETDLALLRVEPGNDREFPAIPLGDSDVLRVGEWVCAIGNPLRLYDHTVTVGVVSYKGRVLFNPSFDNYIQTDAAINFGNSGGPLINSRGEVVGINTAVSQQGQGIGFAIPINTAKAILVQLKDRGGVSRGHLGVSLDDVDEEYRKQLQLPEQRGAVVTRVTPDSPAEEAGFQRYDVIVEVDGNPIEVGADLVKAISSSPPETPVKISVYRDGERLELEAVLDERTPEVEKTDPEVPTRQPDPFDKLGLTVQPLTPSAIERYAFPEDLHGVMVARVDPLSSAADEGIRRGDVLSEINRRPIRDLNSYLQSMAGVRSGDVLLIYVVRTAEVSFIAKVRVE